MGPPTYVLIEELLHHSWPDNLPKLQGPFPRTAYAQAMQESKLCYLDTTTNLFFPLSIFNTISPIYVPDRQTIALLVARKPTQITSAFYFPGWSMHKLCKR